MSQGSPGLTKEQELGLLLCIVLFRGIWGMIILVTGESLPLPLLCWSLVVCTKGVHLRFLS